MMLNIDLDCRSKRFPSWLTKSVRVDAEVGEIKEILSRLEISTVCQSTRCPNIYDCFSKKQCTFLILGDLCTRGCRFCAIKRGRDLGLPQREELFNIQKAVAELGLAHVVITSVTRDDLSDGGASHFADCIDILRKSDSELIIEVLVPDFLGKRYAIEKACSKGPDIFSHNIETVPRLYSVLRPEARYKRSLGLIRYARDLGGNFFIKSGLMVGLGETKDEIYEVMADLKAAGCDIITIGQYLRPDEGCLEVEEFLHPEEFAEFSRWAKDLGFKECSSSPFTRSSYQRREHGRIKAT